MKKIIVVLSFLLFVSIAFSQQMKESRKMRIVENENGKKIEMELENDQVSSLKIDDKVVPKDKFADYKAMTDRIQKNLLEQNGFPEKMPKEMVKNETMEQSIKTKKEGENMTLTISGENEPIKFVITKDGKIQYNGETLNDGSEIKLKSVRKMIMMDGDEKGENMGKNEKIIIKKEGNDKGFQKETKKIIVTKDDKDADKMASEIGASDDEWLDDELLKDKLITNKDNLDFEINGSSLLLDGKKQTTAAFEKYKLLFEKKGVKFNEKTKVLIKKTEKKD